jgi:hypothetical protein
VGIPRNDNSRGEINDAGDNSGDDPSDSVLNDPLRLLH